MHLRKRYDQFESTYGKQLRGIVLAPTKDKLDVLSNALLSFLSGGSLDLQHDDIAIWSSLLGIELDKFDMAGIQNAARSCGELCLVDQLGNGYQQHPTSIELDDAVITLMLRYASHI